MLGPREHKLIIDIVLILIIFFFAGFAFDVKCELEVQLISLTILTAAGEGRKRGSDMEIINKCCT